MITYKTRQKQLVLELISSDKDKQLSCDEITFILAGNGTPVGKTTVYRQLEKLVSEGRIKKFNARDNKGFVYQYIDENMNCDKHLHLRCSQCGKYIHLGCDFMSMVGEHIYNHHNFTVDNSRTEIIGVCGKCSEKGQVVK